MSKIFADFDFENFWDNDEYALENYVSPPFDDEMLVYVESELGYKLPPSYIEFMRFQNGGMPKNTLVLIEETGVNCYVPIVGIYGIGETTPNSLLGEFGNQLWLDEWECPNIGVYFADTISGGHHMVAFDYTVCDENGEPQIVLIDQESDYEKIVLAKNFASFIKNLQPESALD